MELGIVISLIVMGIFGLIFGTVGEVIWKKHGFACGFFLGPLGLVLAAVLSILDHLKNNISDISTEIGVKNILKTVSDMNGKMDTIDRHICESANIMIDHLSKSN